MKTVGSWLEKRLLPIASWVARNTYLQTLSQTFISLLPVIIIGAFALILSKSPVLYTGFEAGSQWFNFFKSWSEWTDANLQTLKFINAATLGALSLWVSVSIAYRWARKHDMDPVMTIIVVVVNFLLINSVKVDAAWATNYFGGEGLFSAIISAFLTAQMFRYLTKKGIGAISFPASVPASLVKSISSMLPMALTMLAGALVAGVMANIFHISVPALILSIGKPLNVGIDNPIGMSLVSTFGQLTFWFGIHNSAVLSVFSPILYSNLAANAEAYALGTAASQLPYIVNQAFFYSYCGIGGAGATFALVLLLVRSKSESLKAVGKLSIVPACFGINEPIIFGLPIMMNVTLLIPFVFIQIVNIFIVYYAMFFNLVNRPIFYMGGTSPEILKAVLSNMDVRSIILWVVLVLIDGILWYPFFKTVEKQKLEEEAESLRQTAIGQETASAIAS